VRAWLAVPVNAILTLFFGLVTIPCALVRARWGSALTRAWGRALLAVWGVSVLVEGAEHCPPGPAVYAANHASTLDIPIVFGYLPVPFRIIHKRSLYNIPVVGQYLWAAGHIGIDRGRAFKAQKSLARAADRIRGGTSVLVFPEGTRSPDRSVLPFKRGSFVLAISAHVPVVPVSVVGVKALVPTGLFTLRTGTVRLRIHPMVATAALAPEDAARLAHDVWATVDEGCRA